MFSCAPVSFCGSKISYLTAFLILHSLVSFADGTYQKKTPFYKQFIPSSTTPQGYNPTFKVTISNIGDQDHDEPGWYGDPNPNTTFNTLWLDQFKPGYKNLEGSKALNKMLQFTFKKAYKNYRTANINRFKQLPDEEGEGKLEDWDNEMEYSIRASDDSIKIGMELKY